MKRIILILATLLVFGSMKAQQQPTHYPFNYHDFPNTMTAIIQIQINGVEQTSNELELGAFNGDRVTGAERIGCYGSHGYYRVYLSVYGSSGSYEVTFKLYNHQTGEELDNYNITYQGEPYTFTWISDTGIGSNKKPIVINFATTQTFTKEISGYGESDGHYYLIASPIDDVNPNEIAGMIADSAENYDLYWFDQTEDLEWRTFKQGGGFNLVSGMGYLYANKNDVTLTFAGTPIEGDTYEVSLVKDDDADFPGWNLVGNPFTETAYIDRPFYVMNEDGTEIISVTAASTGIEPMQGLFVIANEDGESLVFSTTNPNSKNAMVALNLSKGHGIIDRTIVRFGEGRTLPKFQLRDNSTKVYIPMEGQDYAVISSEGSGEMPVNFKAEQNGNYTLSFDAEEVEFSYLHLIDNLTGADVNLLETPSYSFEAKTTDYASRFKLVYVANEDGASTGSATFAFFSNDKLIVANEGKATLQVIDMMGHVLRSEAISGSTEININTAPGMYLLRLVNGDNVKTQKIVVR